jgi:hypothetical protein
MRKAPHSRQWYEVPAYSSFPLLGILTRMADIELSHIGHLVVFPRAMPRRGSVVYIVRLSARVTLQ